jgi:hypothetical protein
MRTDVTRSIWLPELPGSLTVPVTSTRLFLYWVGFCTPTTDTLTHWLMRSGTSCPGSMKSDYGPTSTSNCSLSSGRTRCSRSRLRLHPNRPCSRVDPSSRQFPRLAPRCHRRLPFCHHQCPLRSILRHRCPLFRFDCCRMCSLRCSGCRCGSYLMSPTRRSLHLWLALPERVPTRHYEYRCLASCTRSSSPAGRRWPCDLTGCFPVLFPWSAKTYRSTHPRRRRRPRRLLS